MNKNNDKEKALEYLNRLTGKHIETIDLSALSSARRARFLSWVQAENLKLGNIVTETKPHQYQSQSTRSPNQSSYGIAPSVGIDIQKVDELFPHPIENLKSNTELKEVFTLNELSYADGKAAPLDTLTGLFAAKEAIVKAGGLTLAELTAIEIKHCKNGRPLHDEFELSISHSEGLAVAVALGKNAPSQPKPHTSDHNLPAPSSVKASNKIDTNYLQLVCAFLIMYASIEVLRFLIGV